MSIGRRFFSYSELLEPTTDGFPGERSERVRWTMKRGKASGSNLGCGKRACERGQSLSCNRASKQSLRDLVQVLPPQPYKNESYDTIGIATFVLFLYLENLVS